MKKMTQSIHNPMTNIYGYILRLIIPASYTVISEDVFCDIKYKNFGMNGCGIIRISGNSIAIAFIQVPFLYFYIDNYGIL